MSDVRTQRIRDAVKLALAAATVVVDHHRGLPDEDQARKAMTNPAALASNYLEPILPLTPLELAVLINELLAGATVHIQTAVAAGVVAAAVHSTSTRGDG
jgi:hypothetical protein